MFTGIVQTRGRVVGLRRHAFGVRMVVDPGQWDYRPREGESISVNGVCLTHAPSSPQAGPDEPQGHLYFDIIQETLDKTSLGQVRQGGGEGGERGEVNLEPALRADTPLGGHFVQGHVDGTGRITKVHRGEDEWRIIVEPPPALAIYIVPKGSISIDGVSLTIAAVHPADAAGSAPARFEVALIPVTLELTTLGQVQEGDVVNLEVDMIAKTVVHWLESRFGGAGSERGGQGGGADAGEVTLEMLRRAGFISDSTQPPS